jgi:cob(I)alamin adenosyltransferase
MSIVTKGGDKGTTALMYNRRVSKNHPRVEAYGCVDELNAALGLARATAEHDSSRQDLLRIQKDLVVLMGELAAASEDQERFLNDGFAPVSTAMTARLDARIKEIESRTPPFHGWSIPGSTAHSAALDLARTVCRRAERRVCALAGSDARLNPEIVVYLNRLSDLLWLLGRLAGGEDKPSPGTQLV